MDLERVRRPDRLILSAPFTVTKTARTDLSVRPCPNSPREDIEAQALLEQSGLDSPKNLPSDLPPPPVVMSPVLKMVHSHQIHVGELLKLIKEKDEMLVLSKIREEEALKRVRAVSDQYERKLADQRRSHELKELEEKKHWEQEVSDLRRKLRESREEAILFKGKADALQTAFAQIQTSPLAPMIASSSHAMTSGRADRDDLISLEDLKKEAGNLQCYATVINSGLAMSHMATSKLQHRIAFLGKKNELPKQI